MVAIKHNNHVMSTVDVSPEHPLNDITAVVTSVQLVDHRIVPALMALSRNLEVIAHANDAKVSGRGVVNTRKSHAQQGRHVCFIAG